MNKIEKKVYKDRTEYRLNGKLHRDDGPTVEWSSGARSWYRDGNLHREDGPAIESVDGYKAWYRNGKRHREDGPAVEWVNGTKEWYLNGKKIDFWVIWNLDNDKERKKKLCFYLDEFSK